ncbi:MAG TPA: hypothetical protein VHX87_11330 [Galbitalea sp.]|nr:hypothetical protein [Galbitalea sp.]
MTIIPSGKTIPGGARLSRTFDRVLAVQRPVVLAHIRSIRRARPDATPADVVRILERRYLAAVTTGGALVGATSAIPAVGTIASIALSTAETAGFLEASALFSQSVTEVHGIAVRDPERARTLVMTMILGTAGSDLVEQLASEVVGVGPARSTFWGEMVTNSIPKSAVGAIAKRVRSFFLRKFAASEGAGIIGRAIPFGIGAVIGGAGNHFLGRRVVASSRTAFGPAPDEFPAGLAAVPSQTTKTHALPR